MNEFNMEHTQVETAQLEENKVKLSIKVAPEVFKESLRKVYTKHKGYFNIPGFRKGKAPRVIIEQYYGKEVFHEDAVNNILEEAYAFALEQTNTDAVYRPEIDLATVSEADGIEFFAEVYTRPMVDADNYYGLTYPTIATEPTEEEIQGILRDEQEKNARHVSADREARLEDIVNINFTGYVDGVPFEGGKGEMVDLTLGGGRFIPGFEEQLIGAKTGDDVQVNVTFPEDYSHADLAGKAALFEVEIIDVKEKQFPELDDEFAQDISEFDTLAEYRADRVEKMRKSKEDNSDNIKRGHLMEKLANLLPEGAVIPEVMYTGRLEDMMDSYKRQIEMQGIDWENYLRFTGLTETGLRKSWEKQARQEVDAALVLTAIANKENIDLTEEEFAAKIGENFKLEGNELEKFVADLHPRRRADMLRAYRCDKAMDFVMEKAIATDEPMPTITAAGDGEVIDME